MYHWLTISYARHSFICVSLQMHPLTFSSLTNNERIIYYIGKVKEDNKIIIISDNLILLRLYFFTFRTVPKHNNDDEYNIIQLNRRRIIYIRWLLILICVMVLFLRVTFKNNPQQAYGNNNETIILRIEYNIYIIAVFRSP